MHSILSTKEIILKMKLICVTSNLPKEYKLPGIKDYDHTFYKSQYLLTRKLSCLFHSSNGEWVFKNIYSSLSSTTEKHAERKYWIQSWNELKERKRRTLLLKMLEKGQKSVSKKLSIRRWCWINVYFFHRDSLMDTGKYINNLIIHSISKLKVTYKN